MRAIDLFQKHARGFNGFVDAPIEKIIAHNPNGMCLWVQDDCYMELDCPDSENMNARWECGKMKRNKLFPYTYDGFKAACKWFDEQRYV